MVKDFGIDLEQCLNCLKGEGIFLYPTDTVWGLGGDATSEAAAQRIMQLKNRPANKSFVILVADEIQLARYVKNVDSRIIDYLNRFEKPTTVIYAGAQGLAPMVMAADGSVAIRICKDPFCQALLRQSGKPLISTSANLSGQPTPAMFAEVDPAVVQGVDYVVRHRQQDRKRAAASTIIKWHPERMPENGRVVTKEQEAATADQRPIEIIRP